MKIKIFLSHLLICFYVSAFSQDSIKNDSIYSSVNALSLKKPDTLFYENGAVKCVSFYLKTNELIANSTLINFVLIKKNFQYDECGNLRNVSEVSKYIGKISSCWDYDFNHRYQVTDNIIENVNCSVIWMKPLIIYSQY